MISVRLIIPVLALAARVSTECADGVNEGVNNCQVEPRLIAINCLSGESCTCSDFNSDQDTACSEYGFNADIDALITYETADGAKCAELCQEIWDGQTEDEKRCQYYKFEEVITRSLPSLERN